MSSFNSLRYVTSTELQKMAIDTVTASGQSDPWPDHCHRESSRRSNLRWWL